MFSIGDRIIYGSSGVCDIIDISTVNIDGIPKDKLYYILCPYGKNESYIYAPVENCRVIMRKVLTHAEATALLDEIPALEPLEAGTDRQREQLYRECLKSCDCRRLICIIKTLWLRNQSRLGTGKRISSLDDRYFKLAEEALYGELAIALGMEKSDVGPYIESKMAEL